MKKTYLSPVTIKTEFEAQSYCSDTVGMSGTADLGNFEPGGIIESAGDSNDNLSSPSLAPETLTPQK